MPTDHITNGQWNIGHLCSTSQCTCGLGDKPAFRWLSSALERTDFTFADLDRESNKFGNALLKLGFSAGDVFFTFLPKLPEQFFSFLGSLKLRLIAAPLFSNFGEEALLDRLGDAGAKGIITKKSLLKKLLRIRHLLPALQAIIVVDLEEHQAEDIYSYRRLMDEASAEFVSPPTGAATPSVLHYTSGSTGKPKGVLHTHGSIAVQRATAREILGMREDDLFWCTADQGWVTGTSYGIIAPWSLGVTQLHFGGTYDATAWLTNLEREQVTLWYTAPTALRMLMREDAALFERFDLRKLRHICSVGEPLNPEVIRWGREVLGKKIYDTWFQTETGAIMIANRPGEPIRPGSMGHPVSGVEAAILDDFGIPLPQTEPGHLCLKTDSPAMFVTYLNNDAAYRQRFRNGWYFSGDIALKDEDGYFWFKGRSDDVINTAGHLVSPFEVESALLEMKEVAESGVIGAPDDLLFEKVVAFVHLHDHVDYTSELELKLRLHVSNRLSSVATPQEIVITGFIPKTKSGKIMRRVLKARYLGRDAGDTSTLET